jgi:hypothetical protein
VHLCDQAMYSTLYLWTSYILLLPKAASTVVIATATALVIQHVIDQVRVQTHCSSCALCTHKCALVHVNRQVPLFSLYTSSSTAATTTTITAALQSLHTAAHYQYYYARCVRCCLSAQPLFSGFCISHCTAGQ